MRNIHTICEHIVRDLTLYHGRLDQQHSLYCVDCQYPAAVAMAVEARLARATPVAVHVLHLDWSSPCTVFSSLIAALGHDETASTDQGVCALVRRARAVIWSLRSQRAVYLLPVSSEALRSDMVACFGVLRALLAASNQGWIVFAPTALTQLGLGGAGSLFCDVFRVRAMEAVAGKRSRRGARAWASC